MKIKNLFPLSFIIGLAAFLRFYNLGGLPVSPNWDEVSHGVNAYSILMTGKDEWGNFFPLIFRAFGDYKLPLYIYLSVIPVWFFGLNVFAVRFISALAGTLAILGIYLLTREFLESCNSRHCESRTRAEAISESGIATSPLAPRNDNTALLSAFFLAVLPWHIFISRPALEANLSLTLIIFGFYYLLKFFNSVIPTAVEGSHSTSLLPSVILLGLSLHTYNTARVFVPLLVICAFLNYKPAIRGVRNYFAILLAFVFGGLVLFQVYAGEGTARYEKLKILSPSAVFQIGERRAQSNLPPLMARLAFNRPVYFTTTVAKNYLSYFTPSFFSQKLGAQFQFAIPDKNLLTFPVFLLAFLGFFAHISSLRGAIDLPAGRQARQSHTNNLRFLYTWLLLSPLAASLTIDPPQALRPNPMIPAIVIFACFGLSRLLLIIPEKKKLLLVSLIGLWILYSVFSYLKDYSGSYKSNYSSSWQYGYAEVMRFVGEHQSEYDHVFITKRHGEPHIFYSFYSKLPPKDLQPNSNNIRFEKSDWFWTDKIDNVYFVNDWQIPTIGVSSLSLESGGEISTARSLLITSPDHIPVNAHIIKTIYFLDGTPAFIITSIP